MPAPAVTRRLNAIGTLVRKYQTEENNYRADPARREEIAVDIESLESLGRTERWKNNVYGWANMVRFETSLDWAITQGSIYAGHAAD